MLGIISRVLNIDIIHATLRCSAPVIYAAMACAISRQVGLLNISVEGTMLVSCFSAVVVSYYSGSWLLAILVSVLVGIIFALVLATASIKFKGNILIVGVSLNMIATYGTKFVLMKVFKLTSSFSSPEIVSIPNVHIVALEKYPKLSAVFNDFNICELILPLVIFILWFALYKTVWGLRVRTVGMNDTAAKTSGINPSVKKLQCLILSGAIAGFGGAYLSLGYVTMFIEKMTSGRGYMGMAAMNFGNANPVTAALGSLIFGFFTALSARVQLIGIPSQIVNAVPYAAVVIVLVLVNRNNLLKEKKRNSSLLYKEKQVVKMEN